MGAMAQLPHFPVGRRPSAARLAPQPIGDAAIQLVEAQYEDVESLLEDRFEKTHGRWQGFTDTTVARYLDCASLECGFASARCDTSFEVDFEEPKRPGLAVSRRARPKKTHHQEFRFQADLAAAMGGFDSKSLGTRSPSLSLRSNTPLDSSLNTRRYHRDYIDRSSLVTRRPPHSRVRHFEHRRTEKIANPPVPA